jgi:hypothetical protein
LVTISHLYFPQLIIRKQCLLAEMAMERSQDRQSYGAERSAFADPRNGVLHLRGEPQLRGEPASIGTRAAAAIDLVDQAAQVVRCIEDDAAEITARANDLARRAAGQLNSAESQIRALELKQRAAEANLKAAHDRADEAEHKARAAEAQIATLEDRVFAAEQRATNAEARAIEAEKVLIRVEDAIRSQLLSKRHPLMGRSVAAA